ncbi:hypothetical protein JYK14_07180 [Siccirubricoccus sp. KC 17139]|uniref:Phage tail lysozyme domain-containing protein n=1 Tax=Siccirubricoccus soli TaxID=2899147 RepID=A0ABT1D216_9PROT|nr:hypothetical protein [Siccirubricoccus soli]MCO6415959.1 hypothetical protein [Siccirubricoccus soli]MCP2682091.1 hypothetical protein [Siccirubricoccus soli]
MWLAENWGAVVNAVHNDGLCHPTHIRLAYNAALAGEAIKYFRQGLAGTEAWERIKTTSKMLRDDWHLVGKALLVGRRLHPANIAFSRWCAQHGFGDMHRRDRADAMWLADNWSVVASCYNDPGFSGANHPHILRAAYNASLAGEAADEDEDDAPASTPAIAAPVQAAISAPPKPIPAGHDALRTAAWRASVLERL